MIHIIQGHGLGSLKTLPDNHVNCVVTSPPYWGLRDYGVSGQLGLESTIGAYVHNLVVVFREVYRVLRPNGVCFLNLGDSYAGSGGPGSQYDSKATGGYKEGFNKYDNPNKVVSGLKAKDLCGIPWRVALALQDDGWWLRSDIIWNKNNPMPESVKDRPTRSHEYIFLLTKSKKYFWNQEAVREPAKRERWGEQTCKKKFRGIVPIDMDTLGDRRTQGRNIRSVWTIPTQSFKGAHFSTFPMKLVETCIKAGCPTGGIVLDPFGGSMTTGLVAGMMQRDAICIELNPDYVKMGKQRILGRAGFLAELKITSVEPSPDSPS